MDQTTKKRTGCQDNGTGKVAGARFIDNSLADPIENKKITNLVINDPNTAFVDQRLYRLAVELAVGLRRGP